MEKKTKKIRLLSVKELKEKIADCVKRGLTHSAYYGHLHSRLAEITK